MVISLNQWMKEIGVPGEQIMVSTDSSNISYGNHMVIIDEFYCEFICHCSLDGKEKKMILKMAAFGLETRCSLFLS